MPALSRDWSVEFLLGALAAEIGEKRDGKLEDWKWVRL
jgi:hypothetical protein